MKRLQESASPDPNKIMTLPQVAEYLQASPSTVYRLVKKRRIPAFRMGNKYRFRRPGLEVWIAQQERQVAEEPAPVTGRKRRRPRPRKRATPDDEGAARIRGGH
jgi:excisionase family DNA binding protein